MQKMILIMGTILFSMGCSDQTKYNNRINSNVLTCNEILKRNNEEIVNRINYLFRKDPRRSQFAYDISIKAHNLYYKFDLSIRSYEKKHENEKRLFSFEQLMTDYENTTDELIKIKKQIIGQQDYQHKKYYNEKLVLIKSSTIYADYKKDELTINLMRNEVYSNCNKILDALNQTMRTD